MIAPVATTLVLQMAGKSAVRLVSGGGLPDPGEWGQLTSDLLGAVLIGRDGMTTTLDRIEEKLDELADQRYRHSIETAVHLLGEAQPQWRTPEERDRLLGEARLHLSRAIGAADDNVMRLGVAELYLALAYFVSLMPQDCRRTLASAAQHLISQLGYCARDSSRSARELTLTFLDSANGRSLGRVQRGAMRRTIQRADPLPPNSPILQFADAFREASLERARDAEEAYAWVLALQELAGVPAGARVPASITDVLPARDADEVGVAVVLEAGSGPVTLPSDLTVTIGPELKLRKTRALAEIALDSGGEELEARVYVGSPSIDFWSSRPAGPPTPSSEPIRVTETDDKLRSAVPEHWSWDRHQERLSVSPGPAGRGWVKLDVTGVDALDFVVVEAGPFLVRRPTKRLQ